ncbi:A24 family peptidase [Phenylobacterium sp.]|uniref:A24 family peptidase n=1 Tax=Phenylobacterium sp. TaxID=1871053 RepID=UPI002811B3D9|nr:A24 family peptidase [Phenylobacterium sp.]
MSLIGFLYFNGVLLIAAAWDIRTFRIPNRLSLALAIGGVLVLLTGDMAEAASRLASCGIVSTAALLLYLRGAMGGGDVKLLAAASIWLPLSHLFGFAMVLGLAGGLQALGTLAVIRFSPSSKPYLARADFHQMPYGVSIAAAGLFWSTLATFAV